MSSKEMKFCSECEEYRQGKFCSECGGKLVEKSSENQQISAESEKCREGYEGLFF